MAFKIRRRIPVMVTGGVHDNYENANVTSQQTLDTGVPYWVRMGYLNQDDANDSVVQPDQESAEVNPFSSMNAITPSIQLTSIDSLNSDLQKYSAQIIENQQESYREYEKKAKNSQDKNPLNPMTFPYYAPDIQGRVDMVGRNIGRWGNWKELMDNAETPEQKNWLKTGKTANIVGSVASAVSLGMGMAREMAGAASEERARMKDLVGKRQKMREERVNDWRRYSKDGGIVNTEDSSFNTASLTGEYLYPLPKSMEDKATVEVEKGEYVMTSDGDSPMEAKGEKHSNGGTKVGIEEGYVVSDHLKVPEDKIQELSNSLGVSIRPGATYATVLDKYKDKHLKKLYEDEERILKKMEKVSKVKDENTALLNGDILSKHLSEVQEKIDAEIPGFNNAFNTVYALQEATKRKEKMDAFKAEKGGKIGASQLRKTAKAYGISEDEAWNMIFDSYMEEGGEKKKWGKKRENKKSDYEKKKIAELFEKAFGRKLNMSIVDVKEVEDILNKDTDVKTDQGYQGRRTLQDRKGYGYGNISNESFTNLADLHRYANKLIEEGKAKDFQEAYNNLLIGVSTLADLGVINNADDARNFDKDYGFWGESGLDKHGVSNSEDVVYNSQAVDDKWGQWTLSRSMPALDVLTPEQKEKLNEKGIKNFSDLFLEKNSKTAKDILGDDYDKFSSLNDNLDGLDFVLEDYMDSLEPGKLPEVPSPVTPQEKKPDETTEETAQGKTGTVGQGSRQSYPYGMGTIFPEVFRPAPSSAIVSEGLERHIAPHFNPVLQSPDAFFSEAYRNLDSQIQAMHEVADPVKFAAMSQATAATQQQMSKVYNDIAMYNLQERTRADNMNEQGYVTTVDKNIAERQRYEAGVLKAMGIADENYARYLDSVNDEIQKKFSTEVALNTVKAVAPDMIMLPNGQVVYAPSERDVISHSQGDYSTRRLQTLDEEEKKKLAKAQAAAKALATSKTKTT